MQVKQRFAGRAVCAESRLSSPSASHREDREAGAEQRGPPARVEEGLPAQEQAEHVRDRRDQQQPHREVHQEGVELA